MKRLLLAAVFCVAVAACNQLHLTEGNAYPCNFADAPGVRDTPCLGTDVCGINNVCVAFVNEGPRFEGGITADRLPAYAREGYVVNTTQLHPGVLNQPITFLAADPLRPQGMMVVGTQSGLFAVRGTQLGPPAGVAFPFPDAGEISQPVLISFEDAGAFFPAFDAIAGLIDGKLACTGRTRAGDSFVCSEGEAATRVRASLVPPVVKVAPARVQVPLQSIAADRAFQVELSGPSMPPALKNANQLDVSDALDVAVLNHEMLATTPVVLARDGLWLSQPDGGFEQQLQSPFGDNASLNLNFASTLLTASTAVRLSTWEVAVLPPPQRTHTLTQAWPDCQPCRNGAIRAVTPLPASDGVGAEVLCRGDAGFSLVRVTGSHAAVPSDPCETQTLTPPLDPALISDGQLLLANLQRGISFGNSRGSVWSGETLSEVLPLALERVPTDVTTIAVGVDSAKTLVAITDKYLAAYDPTPPSNGFRRVSAAEFNVGDDLRFVSAVRGSEGWGVLANGVVAHAQLGAAASALDFGPRLVSPSGEAVQRSAGGEAYALSDGGVQALFVTADDGLYFIGTPQADGALGDSPGGTLDLTPQLQPEPSVPIRNIALERTPLGTNGTTRARGYLVTSRNVYEWVFANQRWTSRQLVLAGGEPVEVWFDTTRSALGRVGYADGQVYTLPSGFQLTLPIPQDEAGATLKIIDYENFGGWPVALTTTGLWAASWGVDGGVVQNHFDDGRSNRPMEWHRLTLPDGTAPWNNITKGRLFVAQNLGTGSDAGSTGTSSLFVFLPDRVLKVAEYQRN